MTFTVTGKPSSTAMEKGVKKALVFQEPLER